MVRRMFAMIEIRQNLLLKCSKNRLKYNSKYDTDLDQLNFWINIMEITNTTIPIDSVSNDLAEIIMEL